MSARPPYKTHVRKEPMSVLTLCGLEITGWKTVHHFAGIKTTQKVLPLARRLDQVTCKNCLQHLYASDLSR
jgi:hypothetical protein